MKRSLLAAAMAAFSFTAPAPAQAHSTVDPVAQAAAAMYVVTCKSYRGEIDDTEAAYQAIRFLEGKGIDAEVLFDNPEVRRLAMTQFRLERCRDVPF